MKCPTTSLRGAEASSALNIELTGVSSWHQDFDAVALPPCRLLRVTRSAYTGALAAARPGVALNLPAVGISMFKCCCGRHLCPYAVTD